MGISLESEVGAPTDRGLLVRGLIGLVVIAAIVGALMMKSTGALDDRVTVTAMLADVGDGVPAKSDVKYRGLLVGIVTGVSTGSAGRPNEVTLSIDPHNAASIPQTVTARVVPSNVFAVSSVQLVDNGDAPPLADGSVVSQDTSLATVELQTALTKMRDIVAAVGRGRDSQTVGVLAALSSATENQGAKIRESGADLVEMMTELNALMNDDTQRSLLADLVDALQGLQTAAPDLLDAVHHSIAPMKTVAEQEAALTDLLAAGQHTMGTAHTALDNNADRMITITGQLAPVLSVMADGGDAFPLITTRIASVANRFMDEFWDPERQRGTGHFVWALTPHRMYTRADCPRYGNNAGDSCQWAPETVGTPALPQSLQPDQYRMPAGLMGGNVGPVGSAAELEALKKLLGDHADVVDSLLLGPLLRGTNVEVGPDDTGEGGPR